MSQSFTKNYIHIIFSTQKRYPFINDNIKEDLFLYMEGICKKLECYPVIVGGCKDHIHILCILSGKMALMKLIEEVKSYSSRWIKTKGSFYKYFYWQKGYGAFSVNPSDIETVKDYIMNQEKHHESRSFQKEFLVFLEKSNIEYDERFLWD